ncbi:hypothetical protein LINPERHAP1_LOCUS37026 [Linum perenne]
MEIGICRSCSRSCMSLGESRSKPLSLLSAVSCAFTNCSLCILAIFDCRSSGRRDRISM